MGGSGLAPYFRIILDGAQVARPKPDPEIYRRTCELLGVEPSGCVVFEDSETGVRAARAAGASVVGVTTSAPHLDGCTLTIADFNDPALEPWLTHAEDS